MRMSSTEGGITVEQFSSIQPEEFERSPFKMIGKDWMLIAAQKDGKVNAMTAAWGGLGVMWGKNVAFIVIRKSRFTKEFVDGANGFSLTFFDHEKYGKMLGYMGNTSGREEDKIKRSGLNVLHHGDVPYFAESKTTMICKKLAMQPLPAESFLDMEIDEKWYGDKDYHDLYIGEVVEILEK